METQKNVVYFSLPSSPLVSMDVLLAEAERQFDEARLREDLLLLVPSRPLPHEKGVGCAPALQQLVIQYPDQGTAQEQVARSKSKFLEHVRHHTRCLQNCGLGLVYNVKLLVVTPPRLVRGEGDQLECHLTLVYFLFTDCSVGHDNPVVCEHGRRHRKCGCPGH